MKFFRSKDAKVVVILSQVINGCEIIIWSKKLGGQFSINNKEIEEGDTVFLKNTSFQEGKQWLQFVGFIEDQEITS